MKAAKDTRTRRHALLGVAALLLAGVAWFATRNDAGVEPPPAVRVADVVSHQLTWRAGDRRAYRLEVDSQVTLQSGGPAREVRYELGGLLCLRVMDVDGRRARVAYQLRDVDYRFGARGDDRRRAALGVPFLVRFEDAMPGQFDFPAGLDSETQQQLAEVVRTFQATLPEAGASRWNALEQHATGQYRAVYEATLEGWSKRKAAYLRGATMSADGQAQGEATVAVLASEGRLVPSGTASWWERAELLDSLEMSTDGNVVARVATRSILRAADDAWDPGSDVATTSRAESLLQTPAPAVAPIEEAAVVERGATAEDRARFRELIAAFTADEGRDLAFVHRLADMLREMPELAAELPPVLADPQLQGTVAAGLVHALELAGNAPCQEALGLVCTGSAFANAQQIRAIIALSGVQKPTPDSVRLLWMLSEAAAAESSRELGHTALLALGRIGNTLQGAGDGTYPDLASGLVRALESSADPQTRAVALKALANTRDGELAPAAVRALDAAQPAVRAAAAEALAAMDRPESLNSMARRLEAEPDGRVRAALATGMGAMSHHSDAAFSACATMVEREADPDARGAMARYLVDNLARFPQGRECLERLLTSETHPGILSYVAGRLLRQPANGTGR